MLQAVLKIKSFFEKWRKLSLTLGLVLFLAIGFYSVRSFEISSSDISYAPFLMLLFVAVPLQALCSSMSLAISARIVDAKIKFPKAIVISSVAAFSEIFPLPAGGLIRGAAYINSGASLSDSIRIVIVSSLLTLLLTCAIAGIPLYIMQYQMGLVVSGAGGIGVCVCILWFIFRAGMVAAIMVVGIRVIIIIFGIFRLILAFSILSYPLSYDTATVFLMAAQLGNTIAVIPAGLGITELLSVLLGEMINISPATAFIAVSINRIAGLAVNGSITFVASISGLLTSKSS